ncbi:cytidylate kinase-like family protein [bacterium C-53]|nr:cytidylate kinase-like family protein [Lachnospiraceae bacterium]NBI02530.1 cytidylate kinase-like family protein [Lachnospiraceae bacterium]RKJ11621.1 cytidylate kinase-like family protein [bacterium C-53]
MDNYVITIARGYGSGGKTMGKMLAEELHINYYDKELAKLASEDSGIHEGLFGITDEKVKHSLFQRKSGLTSEESLFAFQADTIRRLAQNESCIIVGRCADYVLKGYPNVVRLFIYAEKEACIREVVERFRLSEKEAARKIETIDKERSAYYKYHTGRDWENAMNYDLCLNSGELGLKKCVQIVRGYMKVKFDQ